MALTDKDGSGNVNDVVRDGMVKVPGLKTAERRRGTRPSRPART